MQGDAKVIEYLNRALKHELTAVNQYWLHYRLLDHWGYLEMAKKWREESIEEMRHADTLTARILFLDATPTCSRSIRCGSARTSRRSSIAISPPRTRRARFISTPRNIARASTTAR